MVVAPSSILVVGSGLTGAVCGRALCRLLPPGSSVVVWEALDVLGGRMHTERTSAGGVCDTGAQYVTVTDDAAVAEANAPLYSELTTAGILTPLRGRIEGGRAADGGGANYVAPLGLSSIVSHVFASAGLEPTRARRAVNLRAGMAADGARRGAWELRAADGHTQRFDGVVLTQPVPEMLELLDSGEAAAWLAAAETGAVDAAAAADGMGTGTAGHLSRSALSGVQYSSRYALTLFFPSSSAAAFAEHADWVARYITKDEDDAIVYLGYDSAKRLGGPAEVAAAAAAPQSASSADAAPLSLIVHSSVPYGIKNLKAAASEEHVQQDLLGRVQKLLPWLPPPEQSVLKVWKLSQVRYPIPLPHRPAADGAGVAAAAAPVACWPLAPPDAQAAVATPPLILAGDAFSPLGSRFDGCVQSGEGAAQAMAKALAE